MKKTVIFLVAAIFLAGSVCFGAKIDLAKVAVPRDSGRIVETYVSPNPDAPVIAYLQSIHVNYEAQKALAAVLESLIRDNGFDLVLVEGKPAGLDKDFKYLREKASQEAREITAEDFLRKGKIKCTTYLDLTTDYKFTSEGIEDMASYQKEAEDLVAIYGIKDNMTKLISSLKNTASSLKLHIYTKEQRDLDDKIAAYDKDEIGLVEYVKFVDTAAKANGIDVKASPNLVLFMESSDLEGQINFPAVETERQTVFTAVEKALKGKAKEDLTSANLKFRTGDMTQAQFYTYLKDAAEVAKVDLTPHKNLSLYTKYITTYEKIDTGKLFKEIDQAVDKLKTAMAKTPEQQQLGKIDKALTILSDMLNTKLVPDEFNYYQANKADFDATGWQAFLKNNSAKFGLTNPVPDDVSIIKANMPLLEKFYAASFDRDNAFVANIKSSLAKYKKDRAVFLCGGFHTPNMKKLLKENGFSYIIIAPRIDIVSDYSNIYREGIKSDLEYLKKNPQAITANATNLERVDEIATISGELEGGVAEAQAKADAAIAELNKAQADTSVSAKGIAVTIAGTSYSIDTWGDCHEVLKAAKATNDLAQIKLAAKAVSEAFGGKPLEDEAGNLSGLAAEASTVLVRVGPNGEVIETVTVPEDIYVDKNLPPERKLFVHAHEVAHRLISKLPGLRAILGDREEAVVDAVARQVLGRSPLADDAENINFFINAARQIAKADQGIADIIAKIQAPTPITFQGLRDALEARGIKTEAKEMDFTGLRRQTTYERLKYTATAYGLPVVDAGLVSTLMTAIDTNNVGVITSTLPANDPLAIVQIVSAASYKQERDLKSIVDTTPALGNAKDVVDAEVDALDAYFAQAEKILGTRFTPEQKAAAAEALKDDRSDTTHALAAIASGNATKIEGKVTGIQIFVDATIDSDGKEELIKSAKTAVAGVPSLQIQVTPFTNDDMLEKQKAAALKNGRIPIVLSKNPTKKQMTGNTVVLKAENLKSQNGIDTAQAVIRSAIKIEGLKAITDPVKQKHAASRVAVGLSALTFEKEGKVTVDEVLALVPGVKDDDERLRTIIRLVLLPAATPQEIQMFMQHLMFASFA